MQCGRRGNYWRGRTVQISWATSKSHSLLASSTAQNYHVMCKYNVHVHVPGLCMQSIVHTYSLVIGHDMYYMYNVTTALHVHVHVHVCSA